MKLTGNRSLFLLCEECESAWNAPEKVFNYRSNFDVAGLHFKHAREAEV
jgi:hypothetical protein